MQRDAPKLWKKLVQPKVDKAVQNYDTLTIVSGLSIIDAEVLKRYGEKILNFHTSYDHSFCRDGKSLTVQWG